MLPNQHPVKLIRIGHPNVPDEAIPRLPVSGDCLQRRAPSFTGAPLILKTTCFLICCSRLRAASNLLPLWASMPRDPPHSQSRSPPLPPSPHPESGGPAAPAPRPRPPLVLPRSAPPPVRARPCRIARHLHLVRRRHHHYPVETPSPIRQHAFLLAPGSRVPLHFEDKRRLHHRHRCRIRGKHFVHPVMLRPNHRRMHDGVQPVQPSPLKSQGSASRARFSRPPSPTTSGPNPRTISL